MTIVWEQMTGRDANAKPTYADPVTYSPANNQGGYRVFEQVRNSVGERDGQAVQFVEGSTIYLLATPNVGLEDRLYVQGDSAPYPPILSREKYPDESGVDQFIVVTMGSANG